MQPLSRRDFVRCAAGVGALALAGCAAGRPTPPGPAPTATPSLPTTQPDLRHGTLDTRLGATEKPTWRLALPTTRPATGTILALHALGGSVSDWFDGLKVGPYADELGLAIAAVDGGKSWWHPRKDGSDTGRMVLEDLLPVIEKEGAPTERLGLTGISMGGFGALHLALQIPAARLMGVSTISAALATDAAYVDEVAFDGKEDFDRHSPLHHTERYLPLAIWMACGRQDPFFAANKKFADALPRALTTFDQGGHGTEYWFAHIDGAMRFFDGKA